MATGGAGGDATLEDRLKNLLEAVERSNTQNEQSIARISKRFDEVADLAAKKPKLDRSSIDFKSKGNEDQFIFNERIEDKLTDSVQQLKKLAEAIPAIVRDPPGAVTESLAKAKRSLEEGTSLIAHRQKLIKLADRSDLGWKVVKEYESDELADNEDDEKRIAKAEKAAEKRAAAVVAKKKKVALRPNPQAFATRSSYIGPQQVHMGRQWWQNRSRVPAPFQSSPRLPASEPKPVGPCFRCGGMGHLQSSCPKIASQYPHSSNSCEKSDEFEGCGEYPDECEQSEEIVCHRYWESNDEMDNGYCVKGSLSRHSQFWHEVLCASDYVLGIIDHGYKLPLKMIPPSYSAPNHCSALTSSGLITGIIAILHLCILKCKKKLKERKITKKNELLQRSFCVVSNDHDDVFTRETVASTNAPTTYQCTRTSNLTTDDQLFTLPIN
uniref:CCHC-type domain-containing protein n=2 Tax=Amphimedon queenslandica TaxID=400682 RepID=A0A1X7U429_AMPQE